MLYIANVSTKYKLKGKQNFEVRVGSQIKYTTIGKFSKNAEDTISSFLRAASTSIENYSPISEICIELHNIDNDVKQKPKLNLISIIISNTSENYQKSGVQQYKLSILTNDAEKNYQNTLSTFEHNYEDGAGACFVIAAKSIDENIKNIDYKKTLKNITIKKKENLK